MSAADPKTTPTKARAAKVAAYDQYYLNMFRADAEQKRNALTKSLARLKIAEWQFSNGRTVTGTTSGVPALLERVLKS